MTAAMFEPIGRVETPHHDLRHTPPQASESRASARVVIDPRFVEGMLGLERYELASICSTRRPCSTSSRGSPIATIREPCPTDRAGTIFATVSIRRCPVRPNA
jgi:tRNA (Thr-GGU) A37 N-methylase